MFFAHGESVIRHRFTGFVTSPWGEESSLKTFADDEQVQRVGVDPGVSVEPGTDSTVTSNPVLYIHTLTNPSPHDEWTVRGLRYEQDGEALHPIHPMTGWDPGWIVKLARRTG